MFSITSAAVYGIRAIPVSVETDIASGLPNFTIVGLPDTSVREARDRIKSAIRNSRFTFPRGRVTVNLAPAHLRKQGVVYDLPIALSILVCSGQVKPVEGMQAVVVGELGLSGDVRSVHGGLPSSLMARRIEKPILFVPKQNAREAALVSDVCVHGVGSLRELIAHLEGEEPLEEEEREPSKDEPPDAPCFSQIHGHAFAKRGLEIAAVGGHNALLQGPPGTGKTLLARSFAGILPPLDEEEAIEVACIASIATERTNRSVLSLVRPFRAPHHSCSAISLIGGGTWPAPGEVTLAHHGVLFLDEMPEFGRHVLETLRQPLEDGSVTVARAAGAITFPSRFQLLATRNPCPCGYMGDPRHACTCDVREIQSYEKRVSGPLLDRIDLVIDVPNVEARQLRGGEAAESSAMVRARVIMARSRRRPSELTSAARALLETAFTNGLLTTRGYFRVERVAATIATLENADIIDESHVAEAIQYRVKNDRP